MVALIALAAAGCTRWTDATSGPSASDSAASFTGRSAASGATIGAPIFDGGVVLAGVPTNLCVPVDRFGWDAPERIERIESSCDCAAARLVRYWTRNPRRTIAASNTEPSIQAEAVTNQAEAATDQAEAATEATEITEITEVAEASESNSAYGVLVSFSEESENDPTFHPTPLLIELTAHYADGQTQSGRLRIFVSREETLQRLYLDRT
ncbi:MAG: hypothetical protein KatS3mg111_1462 [Pirellulaceae bacterium]|nr:MAG: hypothetical protein KatS3mg111_1462 [Pirellulaceae bacterium]